MRCSRRFRSILGSGLLALLAILGTGLPSHHHGEAAQVDHETRLVSGDHHAHAAQLVEQDDRVPSGGVQVAISPTVTPEPSAVSHAMDAAVPEQRPRPQDRAPPPGAPRAPPVRI